MKRLALLAILAPLSLTAPASAGVRSVGPVIVTLAASRAAGNVGDTYNSSNIVEKIQCEIYATPTASTLRCNATDPSGVSAACYNSNPPLPMLIAVGSIGADSNVIFTWNATGQCASVKVANGSTVAPKTPPNFSQTVFVP